MTGFEADLTCLNPVMSLTNILGFHGNFTYEFPLKKARTVYSDGALASLHSNCVNLKDFDMSDRMVLVLAIFDCTFCNSLLVMDVFCS
jgi:hypothetical protein|tara:strand:+ start:359 stop:622 length:264 start_codon:yes stop_codon:yes gene_type:complete